MLEASFSITDSGITLLELRGRVTLGRDTRRLEQMVKAFEPYQLQGVVADTSGVDYMDSAGIGVLTALLVAVREAGGRLHLAGPNPKIPQLLRFTGLDRMMPVFAGVPEASAAMGEAPAPAPEPREM